MFTNPKKDCPGILAGAFFVSSDMELIHFNNVSNPYISEFGY